MRRESTPRARDQVDCRGQRETSDPARGPRAVHLMVDVNLPEARRGYLGRTAARTVEPRFLVVSCCCFGLLLAIVGVLVFAGRGW